jgi:hypothetical protein
MKQRKSKQPIKKASSPSGRISPSKVRPSPKVRPTKKKANEPPIDCKPVLIKYNYKWIDIYPYVEEVYRIGTDQVIYKYYPSIDSPIFKTLLFETLRSNLLPDFIKKNIQAIDKLIEKEIQHRDKLLEKFTKEQIAAFRSFFHDCQYFDRDQASEYYQNELELIHVEYLYSYCNTPMYESRSRIENQSREQFLGQINNG